MKIEAFGAPAAVSDGCEAEENHKCEALSWRRSKFHGYKESLFSFTVERSTRSCFDDRVWEEVYDCRYKFNVHREKDVIEDPSVSCNFRMKIEAFGAPAAVSDGCEAEENHKCEALSWRRSKFHGYKESLFSFTVERSTRSCFDDRVWEEVYDCRYKFNVHREKDVIEDPSYLKSKPSDLVSGDGGILLIVILQWDELFDDEKLIFTSATRDRAFFVSLTENMEEAVGDVISPIIHRLGVTSPEDKERVTSRVASSVTRLYSDSKEKHEEDWVPVVVDIVPERVSTSKIDEWASKESHRFFVGSELAKYKNKRKRADLVDDDENSGEEEEEDVYCCSICFQSDDDEDDELVAMPCCCHVFHEECLFQEVPMVEDCPVCLAPLLPAGAKNSRWRLQGSRKLRRLY